MYFIVNQKEKKVCHDNQTTETALIKQHMWP